MKFIKYLSILIGIVLASFYLFPFEFLVLPGVNTKMAMAAVGLVIFMVQMAAGRTSSINYRYLVLAVMALLVSLASLATMVIHNTLDNAYLGYIMTLLVWLGGAYCLTRWIKLVHGKVSVELLCNYLITVCVVQCVLALLIDYLPSFKIWVNTHIGDFGGMGPAAGVDKYDRLYGIGAALDIAGSRFAAVMILTAAMIRTNYKFQWLYTAAFLVIGIIGNMIARTTTVGVLLALLVINLPINTTEDVSSHSTVQFYYKVLILLVVMIPIIVYFYNFNPQFREGFRFGFEGFFSLFETGEWQSQSNEILRSMYRFPETAGTWLLGDGYMNNPMGDPYYNGYQWKGFYMGIDVGYLRFIYYFGVLGLGIIIYFIVYAAKVCANKFPKYKWMFVFVLLANMVVWFKVSTDLLVIFAAFLSISETDLMDPIIDKVSHANNTYEDDLPNSLDV